jgi:hypothetical protein
MIFTGLPPPIGLTSCSTFCTLLHNFYFAINIFLHHSQILPPYIGSKNQPRITVNSNDKDKCSEVP